VADNQDQIRFTDGAAYERYMGKWSELAGDTFLEWLAISSGLRWLDVGCGNGAFTEAFVRRCAPVSIQGIDPSEKQLAYARGRQALRRVHFCRADAMAQPFLDDVVDVAVMPLVIFFVSDPEQGVAEMVRVVCPGGTVAAYAWDMAGGFPYGALQAEMRAVGLRVRMPPSSDASKIEELQRLWANAGLEGVETRQIEVQRKFAGFDDYWTTILGGPSMGPQLAAASSQQLALLEARMRAVLPADASGHITYSARANAVKGRVSKR
jgi:SAM-dependent methyltransferase